MTTQIQPAPIIDAEASEGAYSQYFSTRYAFIQQYPEMSWLKLSSGHVMVGLSMLPIRLTHRQMLVRQ